MQEESNAVRVPRKKAEQARRILARMGLIVPHLRPYADRDTVTFPVRDPREALQALRARGVEAQLVKARFEPRERGPGRLEGPVKGYVVVGDIAVFSKTREVPFEAYEAAARALLEAQPRIRAAWLKTETSGEERVPRLIHLAGEERTRTVAREYGIPLAVDLAKAYYNPRLSGEHRRIAEQTRDGERVLDMFAGIGGFALHIGVLREALVVANDINPHALDLAAESLEMNKKRLKGRVVVLQGDSAVLGELLEPVFNRVILNLPSKSPQYARVACSLTRRKGYHHYYVKAETCDDATSTVAQSIAEAGCRLLESGCRRVLEYSPRLSIYAVDVVVES